MIGVGVAVIAAVTIGVAVGAVIAVAMIADVVAVETGGVEEILAAVSAAVTDRVPDLRLSNNGREKAGLFPTLTI